MGAMTPGGTGGPGMGPGVGPGVGMMPGTLGGGPPGAGTAGPGIGFGGVANGTATTLSANGMYFSPRCLSIMASASLSVPHGSSSLPTAAGTTTTLMGMASYAPLPAAGLSFLVFSNLPLGTPPSAPGNAAAPAGVNAGVGQMAMTLLNPSLTVRAADPLRLSLSLSHMINYSGVDSSFGVNGPRIPGTPLGGLGNAPGDLFQDATTLTASGSYVLSKNSALVANAPFGFSSGLLDPSGGVNFRVPLRKDKDSQWLLAGGLLASAPISTRSLDTGKITTLTGQLSPQLMTPMFSLSYMSQLSYSFYQSGPPTPNALPERLRTLNSLTLAVPFSDKFRSFSSASINYLDRVDGTISWGTQAVPLGVTYTPSTLSFSAYFALSSDPQNDQVVTFPNQPLIGGSISVRFGAPPPAPFTPPRANANLRKAPTRLPASFVKKEDSLSTDPFGEDDENEIHEN